MDSVDREGLRDHVSAACNGVAGLDAFVLARSREDGTKPRSLHHALNVHKNDTVDAYRAACPACRMELLSLLDPTDPDVATERRSVMRGVAAHWRDHPDYRQEWAL